MALQAGATNIFSELTALPEDGASYRVYKTYNNGEGDLSDVTPLVLGNNVISVNAVNFDSASGRTVRLLLLRMWPPMSLL